MKRKRLKIFFLFLGAIAVIVFFYFFVGSSSVQRDTAYGITWSAPYARSLGIDSIAGLRAVLDDLHVKFFRIPVYWSEVEPEEGAFVWDEVSSELGMIAARGGKAILSVGLKQPRWPECWTPEWAKGRSLLDRERAEEAYLEATFRQFVDHPALQAWQIENEPYLGYGICPARSRGFLKREVELMRRLEADHFPDLAHRHPLYSTDSGELSTWFRYSHLVDGLGVSIYRVVANPWLGVWRYRVVSPIFYTRKAALLRGITGTVYVSEFQMEPYATKSLPELSLDEQFKTFDIKQMADNTSFAERVDLPEIYFWGAEWWYWMKTKKNHPEFWNTMKTFFARGP